MNIIYIFSDIYTLTHTYIYILLFKYFFWFVADALIQSVQRKDIFIKIYDYQMLVLDD